MDGPKEVATLDEGTVVKIIRQRGNRTLVEVQTDGGIRQYRIGTEVVGERSLS